MPFPPPTLEHVCDLTINAGEVTVLGPVATGTRRVVPIIGGTMDGPILNGTVVGHGSDWQTVHADGSVAIDARYLLRTDDGADLEMTDRGVRHGPPDVMRRLAAGEAVDPTEYTMRTAIRFETADERYRWLNTTTFVGTGGRMPAGVVVSVYAVR